MKFKMEVSLNDGSFLNDPQAVLANLLRNGVGRWVYGLDWTPTAAGELPRGEDGETFQDLYGQDGVTVIGRAEFVFEEPARKTLTLKK